MLDSRELPKRYLGCMFGLAVGDALGAPIEFLSIEDIRSRYGPGGVTEYLEWGGFPPGSFTDDTQMSLATAEGCIRSYQHLRARGTVSPPQLVWKRYKAWLRTQSDAKQKRAPGSTCLAALRSTKMPTPALKANDSKGCGAVMRMAPLGLAYGPAEAFRYGIECGACTHGHPTGYLPAAFLAAMIAEIVEGAGVAESVRRVMPILQGQKAHEETKAAVERAARLVSSPRSPQDAVAELGGGWVAEEALAIAVYCSLKFPRDFQSAVIAAVNHSGDSDSTGCITGAILGASLGVDEIPLPWVNNIEDYDRIKKIALDLYRVARTGAELSADEYPPE